MQLILMTMHTAIFSAINELFGNTEEALNTIFFICCLLEAVSLTFVRKGFDYA
ncbi:hypothetical protein ALT721_2100064 [Alteromonas alvinellae]